MSKKYEVMNIRIGSREAEGLYALEKRRNDIIDKCANEWIDVVEELTGERHDFFHVALPTALYDLFDNYDSNSGIATSKAFLEKNGYKVEKI